MAEPGDELAGHARDRTPREPVAFSGVAHQPGVTLIPALGSRPTYDGPAPDFEADMHDLQAELGTAR